jgi:N-acetylmuramoyl-L-alanine amidase
MPADAAEGPLADEIEAAAELLLGLGGEHSVRVVEALAAVLANRRHQGLPLEDHQARGLAEAGARFAPEADARLRLCRRIARRALGASLADPTGGAIRFHRVDDSPDWARRLMPVAVVGPFLFYRD